MSEPSLFAPRSLKDIEDRLKRIAATECWCDVGDHEDALHDLAADDVPWLLAYVAEAERRGAERGWDEGWRFGTGMFAIIEPLANPYRTGGDQ